MTYNPLHMQKFRGTPSPTPNTKQAKRSNQTLPSVIFLPNKHHLCNEKTSVRF